MLQSSTAQIDRRCGVLLGTAAGDALGAGYEFGPPLPQHTPVAMIGGGGFAWAPGEWTDDTAMAIAIAELAANGRDLRQPATQDALVARWLTWMESAADVGTQTRAVLDAVRNTRGPSDAGLAASARREAHAYHLRRGQSAGNGSLMRTAPVALAYLADDAEAALVEAATAIGALTHYEADAAEACVLWCLAIRHAVRSGELDLRRGLTHLAEGRRPIWIERIAIAERARPADFTQNGWAVEALQAAWCAIATTPEPPDDPKRECFRADRLRFALEAAVRGGKDTDTVAAIAGGLLGAAYGASAIPAHWRRILHGWPNIRAYELIALADAIANGGPLPKADLTYANYDCRELARHPHDDGVWIGGIDALRTRAVPVDTVVSLCRVAPEERHPTAESFDIRLIDREETGENPHLAFVLFDTAKLVRQLRSEGKSVLLHCVKAESRTPTVAALYGMQIRNITAERALADIGAALPKAKPNARFRTALIAAERIGANDQG